MCYNENWNLLSFLRILWHHCNDTECDEWSCDILFTLKYLLHIQSKAIKYSSNEFQWTVIYCVWCPHWAVSSKSRWMVFICCTTDVDQLSKHLHPFNDTDLYVQRNRSVWQWPLHWHSIENAWNDIFVNWKMMYVWMTYIYLLKKNQHTWNSNISDI